VKAAIVIPARFASTRYPGKPLVTLRGAGGAAKPLIERSWEAAQGVAGVARVVIATDDERIAAASRRFGAEVVMTPQHCTNGTERCAAALDQLGRDMDLVVNLQGDAPLTPPGFVTALIDRRARGDAMVATPVLRASVETRHRLWADAAAGRVGGTTAAIDGRGRALYFSKSVIPHLPEAKREAAGLPLFLHVGVYAYTPAALRDYAAAPVSSLEELEGLEQLRFLELGLDVAAVEVTLDGHDIWELNNPEDVAVIEAALARRGIA
jgi:3-deoxy-manno-octulosonate cytidylyltransferase (CMP-KDO synthetase)